MSEALEILKSCDAFLEGHFLLSSGRHSSAYCQMAYLQQYPDRCAEVMKIVADKVKEMDVDVIVGPAMGGIVYAYELARHLCGHHLRGGPHQARGSVSHSHRGKRPQAGPAQLRTGRVPHLQGRQAAAGASGQPQDEAGSKADPVMC